jgi:hypothetical protein
MVKDSMYKKKIKKIRMQIKISKKKKTSILYYRN